MDRFDAFISYSHAADGRLAPQLHQGLQRLAKGAFQRRALRVFHDTTGLSTSPHLWGAIESALTASDWFILLASPEAASSEWVAREIETWLTSRPADHILVVVTDGEIGFRREGGVDRDVTTCLPEALINALTDEPRWLDLRWARTDSQLDLHNGRFRASIADLAAPIHGIAKDDLENEDVRQQKRLKRLAISGSAAIAVLAVASLIAAFVAVGQRNEASRQRDEAKVQRQQAAEQRDVAEAQRARADEETNIASSRALAAEAAAVSTYDIDLGLLLGAEGFRRDPSLEAESGLLTALNNAKGITRLLRTLPARIVDLEISPDRSTVYAATGDGEVRAIDTHGWALRGAPLLAGIDSPRDLALSSDGGRLAVNATDGVTVVDVRTGQLVATGIGGTAAASVTLSGDGGLLAIGLLGNSLPVEVFDLSSLKKVFEVGTQDGVAAFLPDKRLAVSNPRSTGVFVYALDGDPATPVLSRSFDGVTGGALAVSPDGTKLVFGGNSGTAILLDATTLDPLGPVLNVRGSKTGDFFFNASGTLLGLGSDDGSVRIFDVNGPTLLLELTGMSGAVASEFVGDTQVFSASYYDDTAVAWDTERRTQLGDAQRPGVSVTGVGAIDAGRQLVVSLSNEVLVGPVDDVERSASRVTTGNLNRNIDVAEGVGLVAVYTLEIDPAAASVTERYVRILRLPDLAEQVSIRFGPKPVENLSLNPDGTRVAVGLNDGSLAVYDTATGDAVLEPTPVDRVPCCLRLLVWNSDGTRLHTGGQDGTLRTFDTSSWTMLSEHVLAPDQSALRSGRLSPDGREVIVPSESGSVFIVDSTTGAPVGDPFTAAGTRLENAALVGQGTVLAATGSDGKLRLWDVATHRAIGPPMAGHVDLALWLDTLSDTVLVSGGPTDGRLIAWTVDPPAWAARACELAGRNLTRAEWDRYVGGDYVATCPQWPAGT